MENNTDTEAPHIFRKKDITLYRAGRPRVGGLAIPLNGQLVAMTMEPLSFVIQQSLRQERLMLGHVWEALTIATPLLKNGQSELLFWGYIDNDVKDPSDHWYNLMNSIIFNFSPMATTLIRLTS